MKRQSSGHTLWPFDLAFICLAALYAWLAFAGITHISANGTIIDSDLQTYAQGMAGEKLRDLFASDPVLGTENPANSINNVQRHLAALISPDSQWANGLLAAGAIGIFVFYCGWYLLGRWMFAAPSLAALLAVICGVTVWVGWGTFWGISHSDPVPRVFFAALFPYLLLLAFIAIDNVWLRPLVLGLCGLCMWVHGISALNCGAMLFACFFFLARKKPPIHAANLSICLLAFLLPVLVFLWPSLQQKQAFGGAELAMFHEMFELRWHEDYSNFGARLMHFFSFSSPAFILILLALPAWAICFFRGTPKIKELAACVPACATGLFCVAVFCWLESRYAPLLGRLPMGHELVRGLRFLVPLCWLLLAGAICCLAGPWTRRALLALALALALAFSTDRQYMAAQYALKSWIGVELPLTAQAEKELARAEEFAAVIRKVKELVPPGESIYSPEDAMQVRYMALRPLAHSFKDGYVHFYNKDVRASERWLRIEKAGRSTPEGWLHAWQESGAKWLFCRDSLDINAIKRVATIKMNENGWLLARMTAPSTPR